MTTLLILFLWYGLAFGFQNKIPFLHDRFKWLDALLQCAYCAGFHAGWISYLLVHAPEVIQGTYVFAALPVELATWAFAAAAWCYAIDMLLQFIEGYVIFMRNATQIASLALGTEEGEEDEETEGEEGEETEEDEEERARDALDAAGQRLLD